MRVLFIVEDDFPQKGACTSLLKNMFYDGGLTKKDVSVEVMAAKNYLTDKKIEMCGNIKVHNTVLMSKISLEQYKKNVFKKPFRVIRGLVRKTLFKMNKELINPYILKLLTSRTEKICSEKFDVIVVVMGGFEIAAAAMNFKKKNPGTKLVVYQVDPCSTNEAHHISTQSMREEFERELFEISDAVITTPILLEEAKRFYHDGIISKMTSMEFPNVVPYETYNRDVEETIRCLFTGYIYGNFRNPDYCFRLFDRIDERIRFDMIATVTPEVREDLKNHRVVHYERKPLEETRKELLNSDILVNIGNKMLNQVPSKLFEYISYGKPIINICKNRNCPTIPYLEKYKYALNLYEEDDIFEEQVKLLNDFILENHKNRMTADEILEAFETCTPQYCAGQMYDVLKNLKQG